MAKEKLILAEINTGLASLKGWTVAADGLSIARRFVFRNFSEAFAFITRVALVAEQLDHHPHWSNIYKTVDVMLHTHDAGGVTELDLELAKRMNAYFIS